MFGLSFGELVVLAVLAIIVVGPRQLPTLLRTLGEVIGRVRRLAVNIREESGIDEILREEGIQSEIENFRRLASGSVPIDVDAYLSQHPPSADAAQAKLADSIYGARGADSGEKAACPPPAGAAEPSAPTPAVGTPEGVPQGSPPVDRATPPSEAPAGSESASDASATVEPSASGGTTAVSPSASGGTTAVSPSASGGTTAVSQSSKVP